jgi:hypothetical protein
MFLFAHFVGPLLDSIEQAPVQIQCVQQTLHESWMKSMLPTIIQTSISLASIGAGVGIAVWSFRKNRQSEQKQWARNQKTEHQHWIRDQAKAEWSAVLSCLTTAEMKLPHVIHNVEWLTMSDGMLQDLRNILPVMRNAVFISDVLEQEKVIERLRGFVSEAAEKIKQIKDFTNNINKMAETSALTSGVPGIVPLPELVALNFERFKQIGEREAAYKTLYDGFHDQADKIRRTAIDDLGASRLVADQDKSSADPEPSVH